MTYFPPSQDAHILNDLAGPGHSSRIQTSNVFNRIKLEKHGPFGQTGSGHDDCCGDQFFVLK